MIRDKLNDGLRLSSSERQIADFMLAHPDEFINMSIAEMTGRLYVSKSTIIRFAKKLGFNGHKELCLNLARENTALRIRSEKEMTTVPFFENDTDTAIVEKLLMLHMQSLKDTRYMINIQQLRSIADKIHEQKKIRILAMYESFLIASDFQYKLLNIGIDATVPIIPGLFRRTIPEVNEGDLIMVVSFHGDHPELIETLRYLREKKAYIILVTGPDDNPMTLYATDILRVSVNETKPKAGALGSRTAMCYVLDIIYSLVFSCDYESNLIRIADAEKDRRGSRE